MLGPNLFSLRVIPRTWTTFKSRHFQKEIEEKKTTLKIDLQELENLIYPKFHEILFNEFCIKRRDLSKNSQQLKAVINKQGRYLLKGIDTIIKKMKMM